MITNKNIFLFVALIFFSAAHAIDAPNIPISGKVIICGQGQCDDFFEKIRSGMQDGASEEDKAYLTQAKTIKKLCLGSHNNKISQLPPEIGILEDLEELDLSFNNLTGLPTKIGLLTNLKTLNLHWNKLETLPSEIGNLKKLTDLDVGGNENLVFPKEMKNLLQLEKLNISEIFSIYHMAPFRKLPKFVCKLFNLKKLRCESNKLKCIPPEIANLQSLKELDIHSCSLTSIPPEIWKLKKLKSLHLGHNKLTSIPAPAEKHENLTSLNLCSNQLTSLPDEIDYLINLRELNVSNNKLTFLPHTIGSLTNLQELYAGDNKLTCLPASIENLENLTCINVTSNKLTSLHRCVGNLKRLRRASVYFNHLQTLPRKLRAVSSTDTMNKNQYKYQPTNNFESKYYEIPDNLPMPKPNEHGILFLDHPASAQLFLTTLTHREKFRQRMQKKITAIRCVEFLEGITPPEIQHFECCDDLLGTRKMYSIKCTSEEQAIVFQIGLALSKKYRQKMVPLQILDLSGLDLHELSPAIAHLPNLERIFLQDNQFYRLPEEIGS
ncbi:leucine-rich repeat domain-containing protein, partial [bacterium]|nr:leucine-rich repeat domain-containing protein [bacterium]